MTVPYTLRGFRTQFLYTLYRALSEQNHQLVFRPEGIEDLDILEGKHVIECIQVKNHNDILNFSNLFSKGGKTNFFSRGLYALGINSQAQIKLFSFHSISDELKCKLTLSRKLAKCKTVHFRPSEINRLVEAYSYEERSEDFLYTEVVSLLKSNFPMSNPVLEIRFLLQWIYEMAEHSRTFTCEDVFRMRNDYTTFLNEQHAAMAQLGIRVNLLKEPDDIDEDNLRQEFFAGISARVSHIAAGVDVIRKDKLDVIHEKFRDSKIVILHGASGQGKSTLAYRYLHDYRSIVYEINQCDNNYVREVLATVKTLAYKSPVPIVLYMDVQPSNQEWVEVVSAVADLKVVQCLVTIRQEDWNQQKNELLTQVQVADVEVSLTETEALSMYKDFQSRQPGFDFPPFHEVWEEEGMQGSLLEFVYYLTHGESLKSRLEHQLDKVKGSERTILAMIALGNYLDGHIQKHDISNLEKLDVFKAEEMLDRWRSEYFVTNADDVLTDLHPIRTKIIVDYLYKGNLQAKVRYGLLLYPYVAADQTAMYLIRLMREGMLYQDLLKWESNQSQLSPVSYYGIAKALYWKGIELYEVKHRPALDDLRHKYEPFWSWLVPMNFTEIKTEDAIVTIFKILKAEPPCFTEIKKSFAPQQDIFNPLREWLSERCLSLKIDTPTELVKTGKLLYLLSLAQLHKVEISSSNSTFDDDSWTLDDLATVLLGFKIFKGLEVDLSKIEKYFELCLRRKYHIIQFYRDESGFHVLSFLSYFHVETDDKSKGTLAEQQNMRILDLCRRAFPTEKKYQAKVMEDALLQSFPGMPLEKNITKANLPIREMHEARKILVNLYKRSYLLPDRKAYAIQSLKYRTDVARYMYLLVSHLESWSKKKHQFVTSLYNQFIECQKLLAPMYLEEPRSEISELGFDVQSVDERVPSLGNLQKKNSDELTALNHLLNGYSTSLFYFVKQAAESMLGSQQSARLSSVNLYDTYNKLQEMQMKYRELLSDYCEVSDLSALEKKECANHKLLWVLWEAYQQSMGKSLNTPVLSKIFDNKKQYLIDSVVEDLNVQVSELFHGGQVQRLQKAIQIDFPYSDMDDKQTGIQKCLQILRDKFASFQNFSTEDLILSEELSEVWINPLYQYGGCCANLDGSYQAVLIKSLIGCQPDSQIKLLQCSCVSIRELKWTPRVVQYTKCQAFLLPLGIFMMTVVQSFQNRASDDNIAAIVILEYAKSCFNDIRAHGNSADCDFSSLIHTDNQEVNQILRKVSVELQQFMQIDIENIDWEIMFGDLLPLILEVLNHDIPIKVALFQQDCQ